MSARMVARDAVVEGLDGGLAVGPVAAQEVLAAQEGDDRDDVAGVAGDGGDEGGVDRLGGDGDDLEDGAAGEVEAGDAAAQQGLEVGEPGVRPLSRRPDRRRSDTARRGSAGCRRPRGRGRGRRCGAGAGEQGVGEGEGGVRVERAELEVAADQARVDREPAGVCARRGRGRVVAVAGDQQEGRGSGGLSSSRRRAALSRSPQWRSSSASTRGGGGEGGQQGAQGGEGLLAQLVRGEPVVAAAPGRGRSRGRGAGPGTGGRAGAGLREQGADLGVVAAVQLAGEGVDQAVDALVGDALALAAAGGEDDRGGVALLEAARKWSSRALRPRPGRRAGGPGWCVRRGRR
jgi:hypothetical protein